MVCVCVSTHPMIHACTCATESPAEQITRPYLEMRDRGTLVGRNYATRLSPIIVKGTPFWWPLNHMGLCTSPLWSLISLSSWATSLPRVSCASPACACLFGSTIRAHLRKKTPKLRRHLQHHAFQLHPENTRTGERALRWRRLGDSCAEGEGSRQGRKNKKSKSARSTSGTTWRLVL